MSGDYIIDWHRIHMAEAFRAARRSRGHRTQVGAFVVPAHGIRKGVGLGWNEVPNRLFMRPQEVAALDSSSLLVVHAEHAALLNTPPEIAHRGTMYATWAACSRCAVSIIAAGISLLVRHAGVREFAEEVAPHWTEEVALGDELLGRAGVEVLEIDDRLPNTPPILVGGFWWDPKVGREVAA